MVWMYKSLFIRGNPSLIRRFLVHITTGADFVFLNPRLRIVSSDKQQLTSACDEADRTRSICRSLSATIGASM